MNEPDPCVYCGLTADVALRRALPLINEIGLTDSRFMFWRIIDRWIVLRPSDWSHQEMVARYGERYFIEHHSFFRTKNLGGLLEEGVGNPEGDDWMFRGAYHTVVLTGYGALILSNEKQSK